MQRKLILTSDGSHTISLPELNVTYHSIHGAIQESKHVFIEAGLKSLAAAKESILNIFEMGFGTGLNALLTIIEAERLQQRIYFETVEQFPLASSQIMSLNYCKQLVREDLQLIFEQMHYSEWEQKIELTPGFIFKKSKINLLTLPIQQAISRTPGISETFGAPGTFDLIFFDAFAPNVQPELWTKDIFEKMFVLLKPGGVLVTYCSKGEVRRGMEAAGFVVEKLPGPKGKREMVRARTRM